VYTLIGNPKNRSFRVLWALEELGQPYSLEPAHPQSDGMRAANPSGKAGRQCRASTTRQLSALCAR